MDKSSYDAHILALYVAKQMEKSNNEYVSRFNKWERILHNFLFNHKFLKKIVIKSFAINICITLFWILAFSLIKSCHNILFENICFGLSMLVSVLALLCLTIWLISMKLLLIYIATLSKKQLIQKNKDQVRFENIQNVLNKVSQNSYVLYNRSSIYIFDLTKPKAFWQNPYQLIAVCTYSNDTLHKILKLTTHIEFINNYAYICLESPLPSWMKLVINPSKKLTQSVKALQLKGYNLEICTDSIKVLALIAIEAWMVYSSINGAFTSLSDPSFATHLHSPFLLLTMIIEYLVLILSIAFKIGLSINKHVNKRLMQKAKNNHTLQKTSYLIETPDYYLQPIIGKVNTNKVRYQTLATYAYQKTPENLARLHPKEIKQSIVYDYTNLLPDCIHHF